MKPDSSNRATLTGPGAASADALPLAATLAESSVRAAPPDALAHTLASAQSLPPRDSALDDTVGASTSSAGGSARNSLAGLLSASISAARTTVLPRMVPTGDGGSVAALSDRLRYERIKVLGQGGVGEVALAEDHDIERRVAVKRLRGDQRTEAALLRFTDEVRIVGQLEHPGIVPVHDVGIDEEGQHFLVMKYVEGETLETVITRLRARDPEHTAKYTMDYRVQIFAAILEAIAYAHQRGIIHRDIKPANVMVGPFGEVTVMDWGLAKKLRGASSSAPETDASPEVLENARRSGRLLETQHGALLGTPLYMSPEQAAGKNQSLDERSDVFSLGVLLFELLALHHPLEGRESVGDVLVALLSEDLTSRAVVSRAYAGGVPTEIVYFIQKAMAREPAARFPSVRAMLVELRAIQAGKLGVQCHATFTKRMLAEMSHWIDRHHTGFTVVFSLAIALALACVVLTIAALARG